MRPLLLSALETLPPGPTVRSRADSTGAEAAGARGGSAVLRAIVTRTTTRWNVASDASAPSALRSAHTTYHTFLLLEGKST